jgi:hypothetical protein
MSIDLSNNLESDGAVNVPLKSDGTTYSFCMYFDSSRSIVFSDNPEELISRLIPGYYRLASDSKKEARESYLKSIFVALQTIILQGHNVPESEWERALTVKHSLTEEEKASGLPLLLISEDPIKDYELTLNYNDEIGFLSSLDRAGHISLFKK